MTLSRTSSPSFNLGSATCVIILDFQVLGSSSDLLSLARSDSAGSTTSMQHGGAPELLPSLGYNGTTLKLSRTVVFVASGILIFFRAVWHCQVALFQLNDVTLMVME
uniref:Uncharacterized protein n=1 Tax=Glossina palpalis gambiensis TaxID=67801 RepID=A0A1B0BXB3_9MUSC